MEKFQFVKGSNISFVKDSLACVDRSLISEMSSSSQVRDMSCEYISAMSVSAQDFFCAELEINIATSKCIWIHLDISFLCRNVYIFIEKQSRG